MVEEFVDTNIFVRLLTWDDPEQAARAAALMQEAIDGKRSLVTNALAIAEVVWVLESGYGTSKSAIADRIVGILGTPGLRVESTEQILEALDWYVHKNVDFADAYHMAWLKSRGLEVVHTFDRRHFNRFEEIDALEP